MRAVTLAFICSAVLWAGSGANAEEARPDTGAGGRAERPRDAAEAVQEGSVTQWLEHYQRERGEEWAKSKASGGAPAAGSPTSTTDPTPPATTEK